MTPLRPAPLPRRLAELAATVGATLHPTADGRGHNVEVVGVTLDSRTVRPGDLYAALPGQHAHGASFAADAVQSGAHAVLTDLAGLAILQGRPRLTVPVLVREDPRSVLGRLASTLYGTGKQLQVRTIGVTGTNGKTTVAYLLAHGLEALGRNIGMIGTIETRIGSQSIPSAHTTPETTDLHALLGAMDERAVDDCVMEVSSHALAQHRVDEVIYDIAVFTNLSQDHLDYHGSMDDYYAAKAELFTPQRARCAVIVVDDEWGKRLAREVTIPVVTLSRDPESTADVLLVTQPDGGGFELTGSLPAELGQWSGRVALTSGLLGDFNQVNTAAAALTLLVLGYGQEQVTRALLHPPVVPGRMEEVRIDGAAPDAPTGIVDFAHTPEAITEVLAALRARTTGRLVVVFGAGGNRDKDKRSAMGEAAAAGADVVIVTDDNPRSEPPETIRSAVVAGVLTALADGCETALHVVPERRRAIATAVRVANEVPGSAVALLGKGHEQGQDVAGVTTPFVDTEELAAALSRSSAPVPPIPSLVELLKDELDVRDLNLDFTVGITSPGGYDNELGAPPSAGESGS